MSTDGKNPEQLPSYFHCIGYEFPGDFRNLPHQFRVHVHSNTNCRYQLYLSRYSTRTVDRVITDYVVCASGDDAGICDVSVYARLCLANANIIIQCQMLYSSYEFQRSMLRPLCLQALTYVSGVSFPIIKTQRITMITGLLSKSYNKIVTKYQHRINDHG